MTDPIAALEDRTGVRFLDPQRQALSAALAQQGPQQRLCLYYRTGGGKTPTALGCVALWNYQGAVVLAPPTTHDAWQTWGERLGVSLHVMSHAKFRMKDTLLSRHTPLIVDEFHLLGGHNGKGWKKMDALARHLQAPLLLLSATPNYNDAERVYCVQHVLDPRSCSGGFLQWLYTHCITEQNPFSITPKVIGFHRYPSAKEFLASLPLVKYLPDNLVYTVVDHRVPLKVPAELRTYGLNLRRLRMIASQIEEKHAVIDLSLLEDDGTLRPEPAAEIERLLDQASGPVLVFAQHSTVAEGCARVLADNGRRVTLVTGSTSAKRKEARIQAFREARFDVLVGTATLATGTDGLDKVCDMLIILDDTEDASLRRQLIGRIMPRGEGGDASVKQVHRLVLE